MALAVSIQQSDSQVPCQVRIAQQAAESYWKKTSQWRQQFSYPGKQADMMWRVNEVTVTLVQVAAEQDEVCFKGMWVRNRQLTCNGYLRFRSTINTTDSYVTKQCNRLTYFTSGCKVIPDIPIYVVIVTTWQHYGQRFDFKLIVLCPDKWILHWQCMLWTKQWYEQSKSRFI